jgi:hypothetical protein
MSDSSAAKSVVLVSAEGAEIQVKEEEAVVSKLIRNMLKNDTFIEGQSRRIPLPLFNKETLEVVVRVSRADFEGSGD